jgi:hypothetical protein
MKRLLRILFTTRRLILAGTGGFGCVMPEQQLTRIHYMRKGASCATGGR